MAWTDGQAVPFDLIEFWKGPYSSKRQLASVNAGCRMTHAAKVLSDPSLRTRLGSMNPKRVLNLPQ